MDVRQLRHFAMVARTLHFSRAAEQLHITQPPLSQSIRALEREIGADLFTRTKRSVALTRLGQEWLADVEAALDRLDALPQTVQRLRDGSAGHFALTFVSSATYHILPALVRSFTAKFPDVHLSLREATSDVQVSALLHGEIDAGLLIPSVERMPAGLRYRPLVDEPLIAAVPQDWIMSGRIRLCGDKVDARVLGALPLILFPREVAPAFHDLVTGFFLRNGGTAEVAREAVQMQTIVSLVATGMGVALVPASSRTLQRANVCYLDLVQPPRVQTGIAWRRGEESVLLSHFLHVASRIDATGPEDEHQLTSSMED